MGLLQNRSPSLINTIKMATKNNKQVSWKDVCAFHNMSEALPDVSMLPERMQKYVIAAYKLPFCVAYATNNWQADYTNHNQIKYEPWIKIKADKKNKSGVGLSLGGYDCWRTYSIVGPRLCYPDWETMQKGFEMFHDVYTDLYIIPD